MKKFATLSVFCFFSFFIIAQNGGISFESSDWQAALDKAKAENKLIFLDAYASWCGPCKKMAKDVFTLEEVGEYFNGHFINVKMNMEKGEGPSLSEKYGVRAYPTLFFIDGNGELMHKALGYHKADQLIALGEAAQDEENRLGALAMRHRAGESNAAFLKKYSEVLHEAYDDRAATIANDYLATQDDWTTPENAEYIVTMSNEDPTSPLYKYMAKHRADLMPHVDADVMDQKLKYGAMRYFKTANLSDDEIHAYYVQQFADQGEQYHEEYLLRKYSRMESEEMTINYFETAKSYFKKYEINDWQMLNRVAWAAFENTDDKITLKHAIDWTRQSIAIDENYANTDTLAALYYKLGNKSEALKAAKKAIAVAKESGLDYKETENLLNQINEM